MVKTADEIMCQALEEKMEKLGVEKWQDELPLKGGGTGMMLFNGNDEPVIMVENKTMKISDLVPDRCLDKMGEPDYP